MNTIDNIQQMGFNEERHPPQRVLYICFYDQQNMEISLTTDSYRLYLKMSVLIGSDSGPQESNTSSNHQSH